MVDAALISAPSSTKNAKGERDPEMKQSRIGQQRYLGVNADSGLVHTVLWTAGNLSDVVQAHAQLHGRGTDVFGDAGYQGAHKRPAAAN